MSDWADKIVILTDWRQENEARNPDPPRLFETAHLSSRVLKSQRWNVKKLVTNCADRLCQLGMDYDRDPLLSFRAKTDRWADRARAEAKAVRLALAQGPADSAAAAAASRRLFRIVEFIRAANSRTIDALPAMIKENGVTPDDADQFQAVADEIIAVNGEMSALLLANTASLRAAMKRGRR
jgi:hypothetical protein